MDLTTKSLIAYFSNSDKFDPISAHCVDAFRHGVPEKDTEAFIERLSKDLARHILRSRPRKKSKKSRIRAPISFGPADMSEIN